MRSIFTLIILGSLTISLVFPTVQISAIQDFITETEKSVDGVDKPPSLTTVADATTEQISKDPVKNVKTSESESEKTNHVTSYHVSSPQSDHKFKARFWQ